MGAASSERDDATSPSIATTPSLEINLRTTVADWPACDWSSSVSSWIFLPSTPSPALSLSTASCVPLCDDWPNVASLPVSEANSPTLMMSLVAADSPGGLLQPVRNSETATAARNDPRQIFMVAPKVCMMIFVRRPTCSRQARKFRADFQPCFRRRRLVWDDAR